MGFVIKEVKDQPEPEKKNPGRFKITEVPNEEPSPVQAHRDPPPSNWMPIDEIEFQKKLHEDSMRGVAPINNPDSWQYKLYYNVPGGAELIRLALNADKELSFGYWDPTKELPKADGFSQKLADSVGRGFGFLGSMLLGPSKLAGVVVPGALPKASYLTRALRGSAAGAAALGAHGLIEKPHDGYLNPAERLKTAGKEAAVGAALGPFNEIPFMDKAAVRIPANSALFTGMGLAGGQPLSDASASGIGLSVGMEALPHRAAPEKPGVIPGGEKPVKTDTPSLEKTLSKSKEVEALLADDLTNPETLIKWAEEAEYTANIELSTGLVDSAHKQKQAAEFFREEARKAEINLKKAIAESKSFDKMTPTERLAAPRKNDKFSELRGMFLRGDISADEYFNGIEDYTKDQPGAISEEKLIEAKKAIDAERKEIAAKNKEDRGKRALPNNDKVSVLKRAMVETVTPQLMGQLRKEGALGDVSLSELRDKRRTLLDVANGRADSPLVDLLQRGGESGELVKARLAKEMTDAFNGVLELSGTKKGSKEASILGKIISLTPSGVNAVELKKLPGVKNLLKDIAPENQAEILLSAVKSRELYDAHKDWRDAINSNFLGRDFEGKPNYLPDIEKRSRNPITRLEQVTRPMEAIRPREARVREDRGVTAVSTPREKFSSGEYRRGEREFDAWKLAESYISDASHKLAYQPVISATEATVHAMNDEIFQSEQRVKKIGQEISKIKKSGMEGGDVDEYLDELKQEVIKEKQRQKGLDRSADAIKGVMQASYNNVSYGAWNKLMEKWMSTTISHPTLTQAKGARTGVALNKSAAAIKEMFNMAKYKINIPFIALRQGGSLGQLYGMENISFADILGGLKDTLATLPGDITGRGSYGKDLNLGTYVGSVKSGTHGRLASEGKSGFGPTKLGPKGFARTIDEITNIPTNYVEELTGRFSALTAARMADRLGITGQAKNDRLSDVISMTQSEYNHESRAEALRSPVGNALMPAQSFAMEAGQNLYRAEWKDKARLITGMLITNMGYQLVNSYYSPKEKDEIAKFVFNSIMTTLESFVPWSSVVAGGGPSGGQTYIASMFGDIGMFSYYMKKANKASGNGDEKNANIYRGRAWNEIVKNFVPAGGQLSRVLMANVMHERGLISKEELPLAKTLGWWATDGGKNYLRRLNGLKPIGDKKKNKRTSPYDLWKK